MELSYPIFVTEITERKAVFTDLISHLSDSVSLDEVEIKASIRLEHHHMIDLMDEVCCY